MKKLAKLVCGWERWVEPFTRTVLRVSTECRFCKQRDDKRIFNRMVRDGLDFDPASVSSRPVAYMMPEGSEVIEMVVSNQRGSGAFICIPCAKKLLANLQREIKRA